VYLVLVNALAYALPFAIAARLGLLLCLGGSAGILLSAYARGEFPPSPSELALPPRRVAALLGTVIALAGLAFARNAGSDEWSWFHLPLPATILEGNFPIRWVTMPWYPMAYHYAPALLVASLSSLTGLSLVASHALLPPLSAAGIVLFAGALAYELSRSWRTAALCGILALAAGGLFWLQGLWLLNDLFQHTILQLSIDPPTETAFRWLTPTIRNMPAQPLLMMLGHRPIALGSAFTFALLSMMHGTWESPREQRIWWVLTSIVLGLALALTMETTLVVLLGVLMVTVIALLFWKHPLARRTALLTLAFALLTLALALLQGGVLSTLTGYVGLSTFSLKLDFLLELGGTRGEETVALWEWRFWRDLGPHLVLLVLAISSFLQRMKLRGLTPVASSDALLGIAAEPRTRGHAVSTSPSVHHFSTTSRPWPPGARGKGGSPFLLFLSLLAASHFLLPLFVVYETHPANLQRLLTIGFALSSLVIGLFLGTAWAASASHWRRSAIGAVVTAMLLASSLHAPLRLLFPTLELEGTPLFPRMPEVTALEEKLYGWVREHSTIEDPFYLYVPDDLPEGMSKRSMLFATETGRSTIGQEEVMPPSDLVPLLNAMHERCETEAFEELGVRHLVVETEEQATWFREHCNPDAWLLQYGEELQEPRIYALSR
jgi:hypothetical protein